MLVKQLMSNFVVAVIPARVLLDTAYSHRLKAKVQPDGSYQLEGSQRLINPERLKEISQFIASPEAAFPNAMAAQILFCKSVAIKFGACQWVSC